MKVATPKTVLDTTHPLQQGQASGDLHPGPANEQLAISYASGYLRGKTNPGNPGKLETDEKSGEGLTSRNFSPRYSNPKHTCPSSLIVLRGRRCSPSLPGLSLLSKSAGILVAQTTELSARLVPGHFSHPAEGKGWVGHLQDLGNRAQGTGCAPYSPLWA